MTDENNTTAFAVNHAQYLKVAFSKRASSMDIEDVPQQIIPFESSKTVSVHDSPVSVFDVAAYILGKLGTITTIKLQKLVYYCQAWSLVWDEESLFDEKIEAWVNGPVVRDLYAFHRGMFQISSIPIGIPGHLSKKQKETIDAVIDFYGKKSGQELVEISHLEKPWIEARKGLNWDERGENVISNESMADYYLSISVK